VRCTELTKRLKKLEDSLKREITFGGKETQRVLTKLYNNIEVIMKETDVLKRDNMLIENQRKIDEQSQLWDEKRIMHFYIVGEANQGGNRFVTFDFEKKTLTYKPYRGKKIIITYSCSGSQQEQLKKLQAQIDVGKISVTLKISTKQVCISFDDEKLSEFYLEETTKRKELAKIKKMDIPDEEKRKLRYTVKTEYEEEAKAKKLTEKIKNRYMSVDLNPEYIGFCIADKGLNGIKKIIHEGVVDLTELNKKLGLASDNIRTIKQNSKRRNEICNVWKKIFDTATRFRVAHFVKENLSNLGANEKFDSKSSNQKVRNFWHRTLTEHQITKRCTKYGIELIEVDPAYSSFIGNMLYNNFDATNAAIEICRRGMFKFSEGLSYPPVPGTIFDTMVRLADYRKVVVSQLVAQKLQASKDWKELYGIVNNVLRWRWDWDGVSKLHSVFSLGSDKSKVKFIQFVG
jgi:IS605 OrfB family transposase